MTSVMNRKVILSVAPGGQTAEAFQLSPKTPEQVANSIEACAREGAAMVHLHARDAVGKPAHELGAFSRTIDLLRNNGSSIIVQGSTGGLATLTSGERCITLGDPRVESASLNLGSINYGKTVHINAFPDVQYWAERMRDAGIRPELQIFDIGMFKAAELLTEAGLLTEPRIYSIVLGFEWGLPAEIEVLEFIARRLPPGSMWGIIHHGMRNFDLLRTAVDLGASYIRVGLEDSIYGPEGIPVKSNHELVAAAAHMLTSYNMVSLATPDEARQILKLKKRQ